MPNTKKNTAPSQVNTNDAAVNDAARAIVFISHANPEDNDFTTWLAARLALAGYEVWSDITKLIGGEVFWLTSKTQSGFTRSRLCRFSRSVRPTSADL
jgi:TIR domain